MASKRCRSEVRLLGRDLSVWTDDSLGVAGRCWPAQEVAGEALLELLLGVGSEFGASSALPAAATVEGEPRCRTVVELGAGCGALSVAIAQALQGKAQVIATDLPEVVPLMQANVDEFTKSSSSSSNAADPNPDPDCRFLSCAALPWGDVEAAESILATAKTDALLQARPHQYCTDNKGTDIHNAWDVPSSSSCCVVACEVAYWGGWDLFADDTREPLASTLDSLIVGPQAFGLVVHQVRDAGREASLFKMIRRRSLEILRLQPRNKGPEEGEIGVWVLKRIPKQPCETQLTLPHVESC
mmetsp:Transcript_29154/g.61985  ORF Transcript_29154/g.61985 Transcript_29154/m.61985 type:complete len:299 (-) Transcript_29154:8-904(-)